MLYMIYKIFYPNSNEKRINRGGEIEEDMQLQAVGNNSNRDENRSSLRGENLEMQYRRPGNRYAELTGESQ